jgi:hypothetical protein
MNRSTRRHLPGFSRPIQWLALFLAMQAQNALASPALQFPAPAPDTSGKVRQTGSPLATPAFLRVLIWGDGIIMEVLANGTLTPFVDGQPMELGRSYTLRAVPGPDFLFAGWSGDLQSAQETLTFLMQRSDGFLEATFIPNPFVPAKGSYNGLFYEADEVRHGSSGLASLSLTERGSFTAKLEAGSGRHRFSGRFALDGQATNVIARPDTNALTVVLALNVANPADPISGSVSDGVWVSDLRADRAVFDAASNPPPFAGKYTVALSGDGEFESPDGDGYATVSVGPSGYVTLKGILADRTVLTQRIPLSREGYWPCHSQLYSRRGSILGWLRFREEPGGDVAGRLQWIKPVLASARYYPAGFTNGATLAGSRYVPPVGVASRALAITNAMVTFSEGNLSNPITNEVRLADDSRVTTASTNGLVLSINKATGLFKGSVVDPTSRRRLKFSGALLQKQITGRGYFLGTNQSGRVYLRP